MDKKEIATLFEALGIILDNQVMIMKEMGLIDSDEVFGKTYVECHRDECFDISEKYANK